MSPLLWLWDLSSLLTCMSWQHLKVGRNHKEVQGIKSTEFNSSATVTQEVCRYILSKASAPSSMRSSPSKQKNHLHATEMRLTVTWTQDNRQFLISVSFAFSWGGGEHPAEKRRVRGRKQQQGVWNTRLDSVSLGQSTGCVSWVIRVLPSWHGSSLLAVEQSPEMAFDADKVTSEWRKSLRFNIRVYRMMVLIRFSTAVLQKLLL